MGSTASDFPIPPAELLQRIGPMGEEDPGGTYERTGREHRELIEATLPADWAWAGRRVLDFGCGSGRILRQFAPEAGEAEFWGCDIDRPSIEWLQSNLSPPFHLFESEQVADLPQEDGFFDLIYALSVYTHLTDNWAGWMLEHHRVLKPGGLLFATFLGEGMIEQLIGETWDEDRIGRNSLLHDHPWELGGPVTFNSPWWIRSHWGRAFEIIALEPTIGPEAMVNHGYVLLRKREVELTEEDLVRLQPDEPREITALQHLVDQHREESARLRKALTDQQAEAALLRQRLNHEEALRGQQEEQLTGLQSSASWRLTQPLRAAKRRLGGSRR